MLSRFSGKFSSTFFVSTFFSFCFSTSKNYFFFVRIFFNVQIYVSTTQEKCLARPWCLLGDAARPNPRLYTFQSSTETTLTWLVSWDLAVDLLQKWEVTLLSFELWGAVKKIEIVNQNFVWCISALVSLAYIYRIRSPGNQKKRFDQLPPRKKYTESARMVQL